MFLDLYNLENSSVFLMKKTKPFLQSSCPPNLTKPESLPFKVSADATAGIA